jgi:hypothetical protein
MITVHGVAQAAPVEPAGDVTGAALVGDPRLRPTGFSHLSPSQTAVRGDR